MGVEMDKETVWLLEKEGFNTEELMAASLLLWGRPISRKVALAMGLEAMPSSIRGTGVLHLSKPPSTGNDASPSMSSPTYPCLNTTPRAA